MISREEAYAVTGEAFEKCSRHMPVTTCWLYGSYARGDFSEESDADILMTLDAPAEQLGAYRLEAAKISSGLSLSYGVTVSITLKTVKDFERYSTYVPYYMNVLSEGWQYAV